MRVKQKWLMSLDSNTEKNKRIATTPTSGAVSDSETPMLKEYTPIGPIDIAITSIDIIAWIHKKQLPP